MLPVGAVSVGARVMEDGFSYAIEEEPHSDTTGEEHCKPGYVIVLGLIRISAWRGSEC